LEEKDLTEKQQAWLALSRKIGSGALTRSERETLEKAYAEMLPREQQDLYEHIMAKSTDEKPGDAESEDKPEDPIARMQEKVWQEPSEALRSKFSRLQVVKPRPPREGS
jgi:hypothetical protein